MTISTPAINCRTSVVRINSRLIVCCEIEHFIPSGLSVPELFARLRPQLVAAIEDAAARDQVVDDAPRAPSAGIDVGSPDPDITLWVHNTAVGLADLNGCLGRLEAIVARFAAGHRAPARHDGDLVWLGDNLGCGEQSPVVRTRSHDTLIDLDLEEALRRIDQFDERGRERLLSNLAHHFGVDLTSR